MKNKILIITITILFVIGMIILSNYLNNIDKVEINNNDGNEIVESKVEILNVTSANFKEEVLNSEKTVLIDFYAEWCGPCKAYSPIVEAFASENEDIKVVKIDIDAEPGIANQYQVISIPTTVVIKNGKEVNRAVGIISKSNLAEIVK